MNQFKLWVVIITLSVTVGSSFIAIKIVLDSISPLFAFSIRFMITGGVLILVSYILDRKNHEIKELKLWRNALAIGAILLTLNVPPQDVITRDNVSVKVAAVVYFRVLDPNSALIQVENYLFAISQFAQTTLRNVCGQSELDQILSQRERINAQIQEIVDAQTTSWGIKVSLVAIKDIDLPQDMQRAMAKQAEAERERRAKIIHAEGEFQAAQKLADAAEIMTKQPATFHLRFLQALSQVAVEKNETIIVPLPIDLLTSIWKPH